MTVRPLAPDDAPAVIALRREALSTSPLAFAASPDDDRGMVGAVRLEKLKTRHRAMIWGMFVIPTARRRGLGSALLSAAIEHVRSWTGVVRLELSVFETAEEARRLYRRAGFREWGTEPRAIQWQGRFVAEHHLVLDLA